MIARQTPPIMNELQEYAHDLAKTAGAIAGHEQKDWLVLAQVSGKTLRWATRLAHELHETLMGAPVTAALIADNRQLRETRFTTWLESLLSGTPSRSFWTECTMIGLAHAAAGVPAGLVVAAARQVDALFLSCCIEVFEPVEAMRVHTAFGRVLSTAVAVMTTAGEEVVKDCLSEMGVVRGRLEERIRFSVQHRLRSERAKLPYIVWSPAMSVGVESIDDQHRQLFALLDEFHAATTGDERALREVVQDLIDYTKIHFAFEETLLAKHGYPDLESHRGAHNRLASQVQTFSEAANFGTGLLSTELYFFLRAWLNGHIRGSDRAYGAHLNERGVR